ncbi:MAG: hypothetical protein HKP61_17835 [Dactylosporangium sp.]|nr:hypothetical protein [Dactylosporangium sp.]NNJ62759.1 hypothetical protein [Dactylosporangium sp.]
MSSAWATYLEQLRQLHAVRAAAADRSESAEEASGAQAAQADALAERIRQQEKTVVKLAYELRKPVRFVPTDVTDPADALPWDDAVADLEEQLHAAERAVDDVRHYGHRAQLLPAWPTGARNAVIYFAYSLPNVLINWGLWLFYLGGDGGTSKQFTAAAWGCCFWPIAAVVAGIATIRTIGAPRLKPVPKNEFESVKDAEVPLNVPLGFAIAIATSGASIGLLWLLGTALGL